LAGKEIKLEDAISETVVADSGWELGAEGSNVDYFEEEEEEEEQQEAAVAGVSKVETQAATSG